MEKEEDTYYVPGISDRWMSKFIHKRAKPPDMPILGLPNLTEITELTEEVEIPEMAEPTEVLNIADNAAELNSKTPRQKPALQIAKEQQQARYQQQEAKRAPKVQIDQKIVLWIWVAGIVIAFIASAVVSFNGITAVAEFVGLSASWMGGLFFFFIELMYLLFLIAYLLLSSRVDENGRKERTRGAVFGMVAFGGVAVLANGFHTIDFWNYDFLEPRMWAGMILSVSAPIAIISASKMASRVVFAKAISV